MSEKKVVDLSFDDYMHKMSKEGITPEINDKYIYHSLQKQANSLLNQSLIKTELQKETSRRKIDRLRWHHSSLININNIQNEEQIDNPLKNGISDAMTLSVFNRPCNNGGHFSAVRFNNRDHDDPYKQFSLTTAKGLFNSNSIKDN